MGGRGVQKGGIGGHEWQWEQGKRLLQKLDDYVGGARGRAQLHEVERGVHFRLLGVKVLVLGGPSIRYPNRGGSCHRSYSGMTVR